MAVVGRIEQVHATIHLARGTGLTVTSAYIPPKHTFTATDLDTLLTTDGAQLIGADANAHALAWDRASPPNTKGETLTQWCIDNQFLVCNTAECTRYARHHGESTPDVTLSRNCTVYTWTSLYSPYRDHHHIFFDVIVGDDTDALSCPRLRKPMYAWLKADWRNFRLKVDELCRKIGREKNVNTLEQN
ncbi:Endonuclease-reverse transcriptase [Trypanosoma brucei equiperdum]|uniref:Endonuclease-reverse transcriptase n=1 Tax=Trypanosoma brucei equiperdum TaxID=630700 RepID=A0A3L6L435_9TRYP|nr:Endonuclease-reverse transcriptase [Trypanosoma brucei equiperdum]